MAGSHIFLGRQPIVDRRERTVAYELLFRSADSGERALIDDPDRASITVLTNTFIQLGVPSVLGDCRGFFNVTAAVLHDELIECLPHDRVVLEILETEAVDDELVRRCRQLKRRGFSLALDDVAPDDPREALLPLVDVAKIDLPAFKARDLRALLRSLRRERTKLLAEKVETQAELESCLGLGFHLFQGYYFSRPVLLEGRSENPDQMGLLGVLERIQRDADSAEIAEALKPHPAVSVALLRLTNSAVHGRAQKVARIEDAVTYLGRSQLARWIAVLLFLGRRGGARNPLLVTAVHRARLMENLAALVESGRAGGNLTDRAFLVGMLSLVDALLGRPKEQVLAELNLEESTERALVSGAGVLGDLLRLTVRFQEGRFHEVEALLEQLAIPTESFRTADHEAYRWLTALLRDFGRSVA
jgi:EAL and modified HD-GYP domain-containing signal transduction protein